MSIIGDSPKLVVDFEIYDPKVDSANKDEGEQNAAMRMLSRVIANHKQLLDVVVYDALVCNSVWLLSEFWDKSHYPRSLVIREELL